MKLIVNPHKIELIQEEAVNEKEIDVSKCEFEFAEEITDDFVKEAYFTLGDETYKKIIANNQCTFPQEVLVKPATIELGVVAYLVESEEEIKRYNPTPVYFKTDLGSLKEAENSEEPTPSEMEQYEQALQDGLTLVNSKLVDVNEAITEANNLNIDANKVNTTTTITLTKKDGTTKQVQVLDGINGTNGVDGKDGKDGINGKDGKDGTNGTNGVDGVSPTATITKSGNTATITITDKNGTTTATISDGTNGTNGTNGQDGRDGYVQYTAGTNITIDENNVISASGGGDLSNYYTKTEVDAMTPIYHFSVGTVVTSSGYRFDNSSSFPNAKAEMAKVLENTIGKGSKKCMFMAEPNRNVTYDTYIYYLNQEMQYSDGFARYYFVNRFNKSRFTVEGTWSDTSTYTGTITISYIYLDNGATDSQTMATINSVLTRSNADVYTPTDNYNPATKKYVDDSIATAITTTLGGSF